MLKHNVRRAGDDDMRVIRYDRSTVDVGNRPRTDFVFLCRDSVRVERSCAEAVTDDDVGRDILCREVWWIYRGA